MGYVALQSRLEAHELILLDGGTGTEVLSRWQPQSVALWGVGPLLNAPEVLREIHETYIAAGADVITTATFRTNRRALDRFGHGSRSEELTARAVAVAIDARARAGGEGRVLVAGSMAPLEDCYQPDAVPTDPVLAGEHEEHARFLAEAGVDFLLAETMNTVREARAALLAGLQTGLPTWISLTCGPGGRLLSGEPIKAALDALLPLSPSALLVNCTSPEHTTAALEEMRGPHTVPLGAYANNGHEEDGGWLAGTYTPARYLEAARGWLRHGARIVGGCCGTTPEHVRTLREGLPRALHG